MTWLTVPAGLILAAAVIPPLVLLYFLKLRRRSQPIACTLLWKRSVEDLRANAPFQRLRRNLLLILQIIALVLLALAIMQPQFQAGRGTGGKTVLLIDNSASMGATDTDGDASRLAEAKRRAKNRVEELYQGGLFSQSGGETMIIAFSDRAEVACPFTDSKPQLLQAIDRIQPTDGQSRIAEALTLARAYTTNVDPDSDRPKGEPADLELFSDGRLQDIDEQVLRGESMVYYPIGSESADNVAFTAISIERPYDQPTAVEVFAALANFNTEPVNVEVQLSVNGNARAIEVVEMGGAEPDPASGLLVPKRQNVVFTPFEQPLGAVIEVANLRADDLAVDNAARLVVPPPRRLRLALVDSDTFVLRTVLEGVGTIEPPIDLLTADQFARLAEQEALEAYDVVVLDDLETDVTELPPGRYLAIGAPPPVAGLNPYGLSKPQLVLDLKDEHAIFRFVNLDQLFIDQAHLIQPDDDVELLAEGSEAPLIVRIARGPTEAIYVAFNPLDSNWPFQRSFVTFLVNAIEYLGHAGEAISDTSFAPGEALTARLPAAAQSLVLTLPDGAELPVPALNPASFTWGPIRTGGLYGLAYELPGADDPVREVYAVNALSELEGDIRPAEEILAREEAVVVAGAGTNRYMALWPWAVGLCLAVMMVEWWVYHRKAFI